MTNKLILAIYSAILLLSSCTDKEILTKEGVCNEEVKVTSFDSNINLGIISPDNFGGGMRSSYLFQDSLSYLLPTKPQNKIFIVDLKNRKFLEEIPLDPNFITSPSGVQVVSKDSIFVSDGQFPIIFLMNSSGEILDSYNLFRENLWEMPKEGFANFGLYFGFGLTFEFISERNSFIIPLKQMDQWFFTEEKKNFPMIGEYNLQKREFINLFGKYEGMYASDKNYLLPFYLSHPIVCLVKDKLIVSFSMDPNLYIYNLEGTFLEKKCGSISEFELGHPLEYNMDNFDSNGLRDYNKKNSYFGNFFQVPGNNKFVRIFSECIKNPEGFCSYKRVHALVFNEDLELIDIKTIPEEFPRNTFLFQAGYRNGFLSKLANIENDDSFPINLYYPLD